MFPASSDTNLVLCGECPAASCLYRNKFALSLSWTLALPDLSLNDGSNSDVQLQVA
jgi:hypothetical protein